MLEVCLRSGAVTRRGVPTASPRRKRGAESPQRIIGRTLGAASELRHQYQNAIQSTYPLLPRPPQARAAHFKRLYRK